MDGYVKDSVCLMTCFNCVFAMILTVRDINEGYFVWPPHAVLPIWLMVLIELSIILKVISNFKDNVLSIN